MGCTGDHDLEVRVLRHPPLVSPVPEEEPSAKPVGIQHPVEERPIVSQGLRGNCHRGQRDLRLAAGLAAVGVRCCPFLQYRMVINSEREDRRRSHSAPLLVFKLQRPERNPRLAYRHDAAGQCNGPSIDNRERESAVGGCRHTLSLGGDAVAGQP
jgi:hypothetical protein